MIRIAFFVVLVAGCAARTAPPRSAAAPGVAPSVTIDRALERALVERCGACHDGDEPGRPVFDDKHVLTRREAMSVALAVASTLMPPPPSILSDDERRRLIGLGCARATIANDSPDACSARLARPGPERWLVGMDGMLQIAERSAARTEPGVHFDDKARAALAESFQLLDTDTRAVRLDGSLATLIALYAAERCGDPAQLGEGVYRACVRAITDYRLMALPGRRSVPVEVRP